MNGALGPERKVDGLVLMRRSLQRAAIGRRPFILLSVGAGSSAPDRREPAPASVSIPLPPHRLQHSRAKAGGRFGHVNPGGLHGLDLVPGAALAAGYDRTGMAHAAARRGSHAGD